MKDLFKIWMLNKNEFLKRLDSPEDGLSDKESEIRLKKYGLNELPLRKKEKF